MRVMVEALPLKVPELVIVRWPAVSEVEPVSQVERPAVVQLSVSDLVAPRVVAAPWFTVRRLAVAEVGLTVRLPSTVRVPLPHVYVRLSVMVGVSWTLLKVMVPEVRVAF